VLLVFDMVDIMDARVWIRLAISGVKEFASHFAFRSEYKSLRQHKRALKHVTARARDYLTIPDTYIALSNFLIRSVPATRFSIEVVRRLLMHLGHSS